jgi:hypothetical protein
MADDYDGKVARVLREDQLVINLGRQDSIKEGDRFLVFAAGGSVEDPDSHEDLGKLEIVKGRGKVIHVQDRISVIETYEREPGVRITSKPSPFSAGFLALQGSQTTEEPGERKSFYDPEIGDRVRKIKL